MFGLLSVTRTEDESASKSSIGGGGSDIRMFINEGIVLCLSIVSATEGVALIRKRIVTQRRAIDIFLSDIVLSSYATSESIPSFLLFYPLINISSSSFMKNSPELYRIALSNSSPQSSLLFGVLSSLSVDPF